MKDILQDVVAKTRNGFNLVKVTGDETSQQLNPMAEDLV